MYWSTSTFLKLQKGWCKDQVPHMWDLIFAPARLPLDKECTFSILFTAAILYPSMQRVKYMDDIYSSRPVLGQGRVHAEPSLWSCLIPQLPACPYICHLESVLARFTQEPFIAMTTSSYCIYFAIIFTWVGNNKTEQDALTWTLVHVHEGDWSGIKTVFKSDSEDSSLSTLNYCKKTNSYK